ncbi:hypothetical protein M0802_000428 [Mischocyttarus mexicanus]|nr:hypothetical protein M0802_000428 [Mischocyttarus mexicanus]
MGSKHRDYGRAQQNGGDHVHRTGNDKKWENPYPSFPAERGDLSFSLSARPIDRVHCWLRFICVYGTRGGGGGSGGT